MIVKSEQKQIELVIRPELNQIAEALMIAKDPSKAQEIKETRRRLLMEHNPNTFTKRKKPEKKPDESGDKVIKKDG